MPRSMLSIINSIRKTEADLCNAINERPNLSHEERDRLIERIYAKQRKLEAELNEAKSRYNLADTTHKTNQRKLFD